MAHGRWPLRLHVAVAVATRLRLRLRFKQNPSSSTTSQPRAMRPTIIRHLIKAVSLGYWWSIDQEEETNFSYHISKSPPPADPLAAHRRAALRTFSPSDFFWLSMLKDPSSFTPVRLAVLNRPLTPHALLRRLELLLR